jgi:hypothetical protein
MSKPKTNGNGDARRGLNGTGAISCTRLRTAKHLRFIHSTDHGLLAVEFEAPPSCSILEAIQRALASRAVTVPASATRLTEHALYQWFQLCERDGSELKGDRRDEIVQVFVQTLAKSSASEEA